MYTQIKKFIDTIVFLASLAVTGYFASHGVILYRGGTRVPLFLPDPPGASAEPPRDTKTYVAQKAKIPFASTTESIGSTVWGTESSQPDSPLRNASELERVWTWRATRHRNLVMAAEKRYQDAVQATSGKYSLRKTSDRMIETRRLLDEAKAEQSEFLERIRLRRKEFRLLFPQS